MHSIISELANWAEAQASEQRSLAVIKEPSREDLENAARAFYSMQVEADLDERAHEPETVEQAFQPKRYKKAAKALRKAAAIGDYSAVDTEYWAEVFEFEFQPGSPLKREFSQLLMRADIEVHERFAEHDKGIWGKLPSDPLLKAPSAPLTSPEGHRATAISGASYEAASKTLLELLDLHEAHAREGQRRSTQSERKGVVKKFAEWVGTERPATEISKSMAREWKNALREWPTMADQRSEFADLSFLEVLKLNEKLGKKTISKRTQQKYISLVSAFYRWMVLEGYVDTNVFTGLMPQKDPNSDKGKPFSEGELQSIFEGPIFTGSKGLDGAASMKTGSCVMDNWQFWLPLLALFTGARLAEIAQLSVSDIREKDHTAIISINDRGPDKLLKNRGSEREIPIHSRLIDLGFIDFVNFQRSLGQTRVFPELKRNTKDQFAVPSKYFSKYLREIGVKNAANDRKSFHSFRHTFIDEMRALDVPLEQFRPIVGHTDSSVTAKYGTRANVSIRLRTSIIQKLSFDSVRWELIARRSYSRKS